jgi:hypothetical protein
MLIERPEVLSGYVSLLRRNPRLREYSEDRITDDTLEKIIIEC